MKILHPIKSNSVAGSLTIKLGENPRRVAYQGCGDITFTLRLCTRGDTFSGGMVLEARLNCLAEFASEFIERGYKPRQTRFRAGSTFDSVARAVGKIMDWVEQNRELWIERAKLCTWGEGFDIPLDAELPEREQAFDSMTVEDIAFWREYLPGHFDKKTTKEIN